MGFSAKAGAGATITLTLAAILFVLFPLFSHLGVDGKTQYLVAMAVSSAITIVVCWALLKDHHEIISQSYIQALEKAAIEDAVEKYFTLKPGEIG